MPYDFEFLTIGGGSGGVRAARIAASLGAKVGLVEARQLGGTCVNLGCVPKKLLSYAAHYRYDFADASAYGWASTHCTFDWQELLNNKNAEVHRLNGVYERALERVGASIIRGRAQFVDPHTVEVDGRHITAERILIATGGRPARLEIPGGELAITSDEAFHLDHLPRRVMVVGGGYIALEFASIFRGLGCSVVLVHRGDGFLRGFDRDIRIALGEQLGHREMDIHFHTEVFRIDRHAKGDLHPELSDGSRLHVDLVMQAVGRHPNTQGLGLEKIGVETKPNGGVVVDDEFRSTQPHIFAVGDVIDRVALTPVALAEGSWVANRLFGDNSTAALSYENIPTSVFTIPPVGTVGLTEQQARERFEEVDVYVSSFRPLKHTMTGADEHSTMKLVVDAKTDRVLGCHMVGEDAPEIIQGVAIALTCGATKAQFDSTLGIHPTAAEELVTMRRKRVEPPTG